MEEMERIFVRKMDPDERQLVQALFEKVFTETFSADLPAFEETTDGEQIYVAMLGNKIVGMASVWEPDRFIHYLFVDPSARKRKAGSTLVGYLAEVYDLPLTLKCLVKNERGLAFYRATGWEESGTGHVR